ncbi:hypothetical protein EDEG_00834, partial [Edhazardia aedis USNM 41457]
MLSKILILSFIPFAITFCLAKQYFRKMPFKGIDVHKSEKVCLPEALGIFSGISFIITLFLYSIYTKFCDKKHSRQKNLWCILCIGISVSGAIIFGVIDDLFEIKSWIHKIYFPILSSHPFLIHFILKDCLYVAKSKDILKFGINAFFIIFSFNCVNILSGINGLELMQILIISGFGMVDQIIIYLRIKKKRIKKSDFSSDLNVDNDNNKPELNFKNEYFQTILTNKKSKIILKKLNTEQIRCIIINKSLEYKYIKKTTREFIKNFCSSYSIPSDSNKLNFTSNYKNSHIFINKDNAQIEKNKLNQISNQSRTGFFIYLICFFSSLPLYYYNKYPAIALLGNTFPYYNGILIACTSILTKSQSTIFGFFGLQLLNFTISLPQITGLVFCPRHRMPGYKNNFLVPSLITQNNTKKCFFDLNGYPNLTILNFILMHRRMKENELVNLIALIMLFYCLLILLIKHIFFKIL